MILRQSQLLRGILDLEERRLLKTCILLFLWMIFCLGVCSREEISWLSIFDTLLNFQLFSHLFQIIIQSHQINRQQMESIPQEFKTQFLRCLDLQKKLKDQYLLLTTEQQQKTNFQKKLINSLNNFYRNFVHFDLTYHEMLSSKTISQKRLFDDDSFGNCYIFIKDIILTLSKTPQLSLKLIEAYSDCEDTASFDGILKVMVTSMFENIVDADISHKDLLFFIDGILDLIVSSKKQWTEYTFNDKSIAYRTMKLFMFKPEFKNYTEQVVKGTLLEIAKVDHMIDFKDTDEDARSLISKKTINKKGCESPIKKKVTGFKNMNNLQKATSKVQIYAQALKMKDSKIRTSPSLRTKNRNCASSDLLRFLGIIDNINFPSFNCSTKDSQIKEEERINEQWSLILSKKDSKTCSSQDVIQMKNLVFIFFGDLFKLLYSMPPTIRIVCKILYEKLMKKFDNKKAALTILGTFIFNFWICDSMKFNDLLFESGKIFQYTNQNTIIIKKAILAVINGDYNLIDKAFHSEFNLIISNLRLSVFNYMVQLINIEIPEYQKSFEIHQIKSFTVCLSVADVSQFIRKISCIPEEQINKINDKLLKKIKKVKQISDGTQIFGSRFDKVTKKQFKDYQSFVLFSEVVFPKDLSYDYTKSYNDAFKKQKFKNTLRQVLLNIADLDSFYQMPNDCQNLYEFFEHILKSRQQRPNLNSIDQIPVQLKIKCLLMLAKNQPIDNFIEGMINEVDERMQYFKEVWDRSKQYYLKAISSVISENQKNEKNEKYFEEESKKQKLYEFMAKVKINACLTSPKTRQKQIVLKTNVIGDINDDEKGKLWLQNQSKCIHTALNLDFIKSLTGEAQKSKIKHQCHIQTCNKFSQIFCSLPEVKENGMSGEDSIGIKEILSQFHEYCIELIKSEPQYESLAKNVQWLEENLQKKLSKRIYDKLYPKYPTYNDLAFYLRLKTLDWISYDHLKIEPEMRVEGMWDIAAKILKQAQKMKTASEKLDCILQCNKIIAKSFSLVRGSNDAITADDLYPIVVYILIKAAPRRIISNINFIEMFANRNKLMSRDGYFLTHLKSAIMYCENLSHEDLGMGMVEFNKKIYEKQINYGIYFMMSRRRNSPRTTLRKIEYLKKHYFGNSETLPKRQRISSNSSEVPSEKQSRAQLQQKQN